MLTGRSGPECGQQGHLPLAWTPSLSTDTMTPPASPPPTSGLHTTLPEASCTHLRTPSQCVMCPDPPVLCNPATPPSLGPGVDTGTAVCHRTWEEARAGWKQSGHHLGGRFQGPLYPGQGPEGECKWWVNMDPWPDSSFQRGAQGKPRSCHGLGQCHQRAQTVSL